LMKLLPYILFEKYVFIFFSLEMTSPENQHCANCIGTLSFPMYSRRTLWASAVGSDYAAQTKLFCWKLRIFFSCVA